MNCSSGENRSFFFTVIFTGSLNFGPNREALLFLFQHLKDIVEKTESILKMSPTIIIAGCNPWKRIKEEMNQNKGKCDISLVVNPTQNQMRKLLLNSQVFVSPVFSGPGMKTKVIEALFHGLPIVASETSLRGYEELAPYFGEVIFPFKDRDSKSFIDAYVNLLKKYAMGAEIKLATLEVYKRHYQKGRFVQAFLDIFRQLGLDITRHGDDTN